MTVGSGNGAGPRDGAEGYGDAAFWRERARQLQTALDSRIVIEQAKGVLAERYRCDLDAAFELLRGAARSGRVRIHDLAGAVVSTRTIPPEIEALLDWSPRRVAS